MGEDIEMLKKRYYYNICKIRRFWKRRNDKAFLLDTDFLFIVRFAIKCAKEYKRRLYGKGNSQ